MNRVVVLILCFLSTVIPYAQPMQALDPDFFPTDSNYGGPGLSTLNPDFFKDQSGLLPYTNPGETGCLSVWGNTAQGESARLGRTIKNYCEGQPSVVKWIPAATPSYYYGYGSAAYATGLSYQYGYGPTGYGNGFNYQNQAVRPPNGHYQICCVRKGKIARRRRPGPRY